MRMKKGGLRRPLCLLLAAALLAALAGCGQQQQAQQQARQAEQQRFDSYLESLPARFISPSSLDVQYLFADPAAFGLDDTALLELPFTTKEEFREGVEEVETLLEELDGFDSEKLDEDARLTLAILRDWLQRGQRTDPYFYQDYSYLGSFIGFQAQLPLLLAEYRIETRRDLDSLISILENCADTFSLYARREEERQQRQVGMGERVMGKVIDQCNTFADGDTGFLLEAIEEELDAAGFLTETERQAAKETLAPLIREALPQAYRQLAGQLAAIELRSTDLGLAHQPDGKAYYEALVQVSTGVDMTAEELRSYFTDRSERILELMQELMFQLRREDPQRFEAFLQDMQVDWGPFTDPVQTVDYLQQATAGYFPPLERLNYTVSPVAESMRENFSPAAYLTSRIDAPLSEPEVIYLNGAYEPDLFSTIAHEGYPGHMYQNCYFKSLQLPTVRYLVDYGGYTEGWASYVENNSWMYLEEAEQLPGRLYLLNGEYINCMIALADIGIHYDGWDRAAFADFMNEYFTISEEALEGQYDLILETPGNYLRYFLNGGLYQDLRDEMAGRLGEDFSEVGFNQVLLETGPSSYEILAGQVEAWAQGVAPDKMGEEDAIERMRAALGRS